MDDGIEEGGFTRIGVPDDEAIVDETISLVALANDVTCTEFDWVDHIAHLSANKASIHEELESTSRILAECLLPEADPEFVSDATGVSSFSLGVEGQAITSKACCEDFLDGVRVQDRDLTLL